MKKLLAKVVVSTGFFALVSVGYPALIEEFPLNEGASNPSATTVSSTVSGSTGILLNGPVWSTANLPPIPGGATAYLTFNGSGTVTPYIQTTSAAVLGTGARTVAFWFMAPTGSQPGNAGICSWGANNTGARFSLRMDPGTSGGVKSAFRLENQGSFATGTTPLNDGKWHHLALVFPGGVPTNAIFYIDGNVDAHSAGSATASVNTTESSSTNTLLAIANIPSIGAGYELKASMADFRIYNTALAQSDILQLVYGAGTAPGVTQSPANQSPVLGDPNATAVFSVNASGSSVTYIWRQNGVIIPNGPNSSTLTVGPNLTDANLGSYDVIVSNAWGFTNSAPALLQWGTPPVDPPHQAGVTGGTATFTVNNLPAGQNYSYQWVENGVIIPNATHATYIKSGLAPADSTNFKLVLKLGSDLATSAPVALTVVSTASAYASQVLGDNPMAYWRLDEASGATIAQDLSTFDNGTYRGYSGTDLGAAGALANDPDTASFFGANGETNYVEIAYDPAMARTNSFSLEAWVNPATAATYETIMGSHTKTAVSGEELSVSNGGWDFRTGSSGNSAGSVYDDLIIPGSATASTWTHVVATFDGSVKRIYTNGILAASEATNVFPTTVLWRIGADSTYQNTAGTYFDGKIDEPAFYWRALTPQQVLYHYDMGAYGTGVAPSILVQPQGQILTLGATNTTVSFSVSPGGSPPFTYQWQLNGSNISTGTGMTLSITNAGMNDLGTYTVTVGNTVNAIGSQPAVLSYTSIPVTPGDQAILDGDPASLAVSLNTNQAYVYQWMHDGTNLSGATSATLAFPAVNSTEAGTYTVEVTFNGISQISSPATIEVLERPTDPNAYSEAISADGPVDWWRLDDAPGSVLANDMVGGNPGSVYPDVTMGVQGALLGDSDTAAQFTGYNLGARVGNSRIQAYNTGAINASVFTVELWALANGGAGTARSPITSRDTSSGTAGYAIYAGTNDHWQFWLGNGTPNWTIIQGPAVTLDKWTHLVGAYDGTTGYFYVDGGLAGQTNTVFFVNNNFNMNIGAGGSETIDGSDYFSGRIDEVAVYDDVLTQSQVQNHYAAAFVTNTAPRFILPPQARDAMAGDVFHLPVIGWGTPPLSYSWLKNGTNLPGQTNAFLTLSNVAASDAGSYQSVITSGTASATSAPATVGVLTGEAVSANLEGDEGTYTVTGFGGVAGFVRTGHWNDFGYHPNSGSASNLVNNMGAANSMVVSWNMQNNQHWSGPVRVPQGDFALMSGFFSDNASTTPGTVTISGIPTSYQQAGYTLYVYMSGPAATAGSVTSSSYYGAVSVGNQTNYYHAEDMALWDGSYVMATNVNPADTSPATANYAVFSGLSGATATITVSEDPAGMPGPSTISGFQLIANVAQSQLSTLTIVQNGGGASITWSGGGVLQQTTDVSGQSDPWTDVSGASSPYPVTFSSSGQMFYRLRSP